MEKAIVVNGRGFMADGNKSLQASLGERMTVVKTGAARKGGGQQGVMRRSKAEPITPFARRLRKARYDKGLTMTELSKATHIKATKLSLYERGLRNPTPAERLVICQAYGVGVPMSDEELTPDREYEPTKGASRDSANAYRTTENAYHLLVERVERMEAALAVVGVEIDHRAVDDEIDRRENLKERTREGYEFDYD